jgi:hypothetical protein
LVYLAETDRCPVMLMPRLAASLGELGAYTVALDVCFTLTDHRPDYHPAWFGIAYYLAKLGDPLADRLRYLRRAHELAPAAVTYRVALAAVLAELGSLTEAVDVIASVPASMVHCPCCLRKMATIFQQAGDRHAAAACEDRLRQAAAVSPSAHRD